MQYDRPPKDAMLLEALYAAYDALLAMPPGIDRLKSQSALCTVRDAIAEATGRSAEDVQNEFEARHAEAITETYGHYVDRSERPWKPQDDGLIFPMALGRACPWLSADQINEIQSKVGPRLDDAANRFWGMPLTATLIADVGSELGGIMRVEYAMGTVPVMMIPVVTADGIHVVVHWKT
jgi:hypothetical protein